MGSDRLLWQCLADVVYSSTRNLVCGPPGFGSLNRRNRSTPRPPLFGTTLPVHACALASTTASLAGSHLFSSAVRLSVDSVECLVLIESSQRLHYLAAANRFSSVP